MQAFEEVDLEELYPAGEYSMIGTSVCSTAPLLYYYEPKLIILASGRHPVHRILRPSHSHGRTHRHLSALGQLLPPRQFGLALGLSFSDDLGSGFAVGDGFCAAGRDHAPRPSRCGAWVAWLSKRRYLLLLLLGIRLGLLGNVDVFRFVQGPRRRLVRIVIISLVFRQRSLVSDLRVHGQSLFSSRPLVCLRDWIAKSPFLHVFRLEEAIFGGGMSASVVTVFVFGIMFAPGVVRDLAHHKRRQFIVFRTVTSCSLPLRGDADFAEYALPSARLFFLDRFVVLPVERFVIADRPRGANVCGRCHGRGKTGRKNCTRDHFHGRLCRFGLRGRSEASNRFAARHDERDGLSDVWINVEGRFILEDAVEQAHGTRIEYK